MESTESLMFVTSLVLVPSTRIWRDKQFIAADNKRKLERVNDLYTIITDDYRVLQKDGTISMKIPSPSLWNEFS